MPHDRVHTVHAPQSDTTQSFGQWWPLHICVSARCGQAMPPCCTVVVTERERVCEPPPHDRVHAPQAPKVPTAQSMGQELTLQSRCSASARQLPPCSCCTMMERLRDWCPVPQDLVHCVQEAHDESTQCTGHGRVLHSRTSTRPLQSIPPCELGVTTLRARVCWPKSQVVEHAPQSEKEDATQSTGHGALLHARVSDISVQESPPCCADTSSDRSRVCTPPPQVSEHVFHGPKSERTQCVGQ